MVGGMLIALLTYQVFKLKKEAMKKYIFHSLSLLKGDLKCQKEKKQRMSENESVL